MQNQNNQTTRANKLRFTGNVCKFKVLTQGSIAITLAYNEGEMVNNEWQTSDTIFIETLIPRKLNFMPNVGDKLTVEGFLASNNFTPQGGKKKYGVKIIVNKILEHRPIVNKPAQQQSASQRPAPSYHPKPYAPRQGSYQHPAPQHLDQQNSQPGEPHQFQQNAGFDQ